MIVVVKDWGWEEWLVNTELYCFKRIRLKEGISCSYHHHKDKDETFIVEQGKVYFDIGGSTRVLAPESTLRVRPGTKHLFYAVDGDAMIYEVSTHHDDSDTYREDLIEAEEKKEAENIG